MTMYIKSFKLSYIKNTNKNLPKFQNYHYTWCFLQKPLTKSHIKIEGTFKRLSHF